MNLQKEYQEEPEKIKECICYFQQRSIYGKLFEKVREKYESLGYFGGTVHMTDLNQEECQQLSGFFQKNFTKKTTVSISALDMEKALENSKFSGLQWENILEQYFQEKLVGKKQKKREKQQECICFFEKILEETPISPGSHWLERIFQNKNNGYALLMKSYKEKPEQLKQQLKIFLKAIPQLPIFQKEGKGFYQLLPIFGAKTTGDPHFFDEGTFPGQLLLYFLKEYFFQGKEVSLASAEEKANLLYKGGLLKDDLSNHTLGYGLLGMDLEGRVHPGMEGFWHKKEPVLLTLFTMSNLQQISVLGKSKVVYMVENPAVFSKLMQKFPMESFVCGNGQFRISTFLLLDLLPKDTNLYYAGDFDPEGLVIAQKLKERYGKRVHLWNFTVPLYEKYHSEVEISPQSLKKLDKIHLQEFQELKRKMQEKKKAAYQETMIEEYFCLK